jgi:ERCC4-type nuclease
MLGKLFKKKEVKEQEKIQKEQAKQQVTKKSVDEAQKMLGGEMPEISDEMVDQMLDGSIPGMPKLGPMQKMALKGIKKMDPKKRQEVFAQAMGKMSAGDEKTKTEMLEQVEEMRAAGQLNSKQYKIAKKRLGIK